MNKLLKFLTVLSLGLTAVAEDITSADTSTTPVNLLSGRYVVHKLVLTATTATSTTFKFYDTGTTNIYQTVGSYTRPLAYSTNWSSVWTNADGLVITNSFTGQFVTTETVAASTNERPRMWTITVPASQSREIPLKDRSTVLGLTVRSTTNGVAEVEYTGQ